MCCGGWVEWPGFRGINLPVGVDGAKESQQFSRIGAKSPGAPPHSRRAK